MKRQSGSFFLVTLMAYEFFWNQQSSSANISQIWLGGKQASRGVWKISQNSQGNNRDGVLFYYKITARPVTLLKLDSFVGIFLWILRHLFRTAILQNCYIVKSFSDAYSEPSRTSKMELFAKIVNGWKLLTIFAKSSILRSFSIS